MKYIFPSIAVIILTFIDQITKKMATVNLMNQGDVSVIDGILSFTYHTNTGMAFGMFQGGRVIFLAFAAVILVALFYYYTKLQDDKVSKWMKASLVIIIAGAFGNNIDRLFNGFVVDFIKTDFINFAIFNVADIYVVGGTILLCILVLFFYKEEPIEKEEIAENKESIEQSHETDAIKDRESEN